MPLGLGWAAPQEGRGLAVPVGDPGTQRGLHLRGAAARAAGEGALLEDLPEALDQVEPGGGLGQRDEAEARVPPVLEHRVHGPVERQGVDDEVHLAVRGEGLQPVEEAQPGARVAGVGGLHEDLPGAVLERPVGPAVAVPRVVGTVVSLPR